MSFFSSFLTPFQSGFRAPLSHIPPAERNTPFFFFFSLLSSLSPNSCWVKVSFNLPRGGRPPQWQNLLMGFQSTPLSEITVSGGAKPGIERSKAFTTAQQGQGTPNDYHFHRKTDNCVQMFNFECCKCKKGFVKEPTCRDFMAWSVSGYHPWWAAVHEFLVVNKLALDFRCCFLLVSSILVINPVDQCGTNSSWSQELNNVKLRPDQTIQMSQIRSIIEK